MAELTDLRKERAETTKLARVEAETAKVTSRTAVICESNAAYGTGCGMGLYIDELEYIQTHWYERPSGCTGGDTWHQGAGEFICPKCGHTNRLLDRQDIELLRDKFKTKVDTYEG